MDAKRTSVGTTRRKPLPTRIARPDRARAGRTNAASTPLHLRALGGDTSPAMRTHAEERLGFKLGKFAHDIERVSVRMVRPSAGAIEWGCKIKVVLSGLPSVIVEHRAPDAWTALDGALDSAERAVRRGHTRRFERPIARARSAVRATKLA